MFDLEKKGFFILHQSHAQKCSRSVFVSQWKESFPHELTMCNGIIKKKKNIRARLYNNEIKCSDKGELNDPFKVLDETDKKSDF